MRKSFLRGTYRMKGQLAALIAIAILAAALTIFTGCGDDSSSTQGGSVTTATTPPTETPLPAPKPEPGQPVAEEQPSPYGAGSTGSQSVGLLIDGLQLANIRWSDHETYLRVVFDFATAEGEPVLQVPHAETSLAPDGKTIKVAISGIRSIGSEANANASEIPVTGSLVTSIKRIPSMDDQAMLYEIHLPQATTYALAGLGSPGRIVIDVMKP